MIIAIGTYLSRDMKRSSKKLEFAVKKKSMESEWLRTNAAAVLLINSIKERLLSMEEFAPCQVETLYQLFDEQLEKLLGTK